MGLFNNKSMGAMVLSQAALKLFHKAYVKLLKADEILEVENTKMEIEINELEAEIMMNKQQLNANAKVREQLLKFLPSLEDNVL